MLEIGSLGGFVSTGGGDDVESCNGDSSGCPEDTVWISTSRDSLYGTGHMQVDNSRTASPTVAVSRHSRSDNGSKQ